jgi:hypothetical protein
MAFLLGKVIQNRMRIIITLSIVVTTACSTHKCELIEEAISPSGAYLIRVYKRDPGAIGNITKQITITKAKSKKESSAVFVNGNFPLKISCQPDTAYVYIIKGADYTIDKAEFGNVHITVKELPAHKFGSLMSE